jgi:hypothetical protein
MIRRLHRTQGPIRRLAILLGVFGLMLRAVLAPGLMPDPAAARDGIFKLIICTGTGIEHRAGTPDGDPGEGPHRGDHTLCPYSSAGHVAMAADAGLPVETPLPSAFATSPAPRITPPAALYGPDARAPPRIA